MTIQYRLGGTLLSGRVEFISPDGSTGTDGLTTMAHWGDTGASSVRIHDPTASLTFNGWATFTVDETDCDPTRVWTGYIIDRRMGRGDKDVSATARVYDCDLVDQNVLLTTRVLRFTDNTAKRSAETDVARVTWLLTSRALTSLVYNQGLVSAASPINFLESDLRESFAKDVLAAMAPIANKNYFVYYDRASGNPALFYGADIADTWNGLLTIRNDGAHDNDSSYAPLHDAELVSREPHGVYSGVSFGWRGDPVYAQSATTLAAFLDRDAVVSTDRIGRLATAQSEAVRFLNVHSGEEDEIRVSIVVKSSRVNWLYAGQRVRVLFQHIPGYSSLTYTRVRQRTATPVGPGFWRLDLVLWVPPTAVADAAVVAGGCDSPTNLATSGTVSGKQDKTPAGGARVEAAPGNEEPTNASRVIDGLSTASDPSSESPSYVSSDDQVWVYWQFDLGSAQSVDSFVVKSNAGGALGMSYFAHSAVGGSFSNFTDVSPTSSGTVSDATYTLSSPVTARYWRVGKTATGSGFWFFSGVTAVEIEIIGCTPTDDPLPKAGSMMENETPTPNTDGSTTAFTTQNPYRDGTLLVYLDGQRLLVADYTETNPEAGTFTLTFSPDSRESLETSYEVR